MIKFGANILSQNVQRNLGRATLDLSLTSERLASGQRINKASDDAAGLAIASSLNVNARIFTQGVRNLNDGLSAVNIAEGAMEELGGIIARIEELASQSISETYSDTQRQALQKEATALTAEWNRIVESTSFNGQNLLTGESTRTVLQGGKGTEGTLAVQIGEAQLAGGIEGFAGGTSRISLGSSQVEGNGSSFVFASGSSSINALSANGRYAVFDSAATNLVSNDTNTVRDVFLRDLVSGTTTRVSASANGTEGASYSWGGLVSADGQYVAFSTLAANLFNGDGNGFFDAVVKDMQSGVVTSVSTSSTGVAGNGNSYARAMSSDGRFVAFNSYGTNLVVGDTNGQLDVFVKDLVTGTTTRVSTSSSGVEASGYYSTANAISGDGRYVGFFSVAGNLVSGDTNGSRDAFVKNVITGITTRVSTDSSGNQTNLGSSSSTAALSADGRYVAFHSTASNLVNGDTNSVSDGFIKDMLTGTTTRVTIGANGEQGNGNSYITSMSSDGRYVAFSSAASTLVAGDTNGAIDTFIKDTLTGELLRINVNSSGAEAGLLSTSTGAALSADGRFALFSSTATNLINGDTNGVEDVFLRDLTKTGVQTLSGVVVSNKASAKVTLDLAQRYRAELLDYRSKLGATTSRISTFVNTLQSSTINYKAASSRITDADIAEEAAKSIASGIRQQVASSLLGQANQAPQIGLQLLRNA